MTTRLQDLGEKRIISDILRQLDVTKKAPIELNDDTQVFPEEGRSQDYQWLVSSDRTPSKLRAFQWGIMSYSDYGRYCVVSNVSDVLAMGGYPYGFLLNVAAPPSMLLSDFKELLKGVASGLNEYNICLMGGDTKEGDILNMVGIAIGWAETGKLLYRSNMKSGETICISGTEPLGLTPGAFLFYKHKNILTSNMVERLEPEFKSALISASANSYFPLELTNWGQCSAAIDNSDGIYKSVGELASASQKDVSISVSLEDIHPATKEIAEFLEKDPIDICLAAGADFRLIFSTDSRHDCPIPCRVIGQVSGQDYNGSVSVVSKKGKDSSEYTGWIHFQ